jgi:hypothetical protein
MFDDEKDDAQLAKFMRAYVEAHDRNPKKTTIDEVERFFLEKIRAVRHKERESHAHASAQFNKHVCSFENLSIAEFTEQIARYWLKQLTSLTGQPVERRRW